MSADRVVIVGTGLIGRAWAITFARGGAEVSLHDAAPAAAPAALGFIERVLGDLDLAYNAMVNANATVTAHLRSVVKVHEAQQEALSHLGLDDDLRVRISDQAAAFSGEVNELLGWRSRP